MKRCHRCRGRIWPWQWRVSFGPVDQARRDQRWYHSSCVGAPAEEQLTALITDQIMSVDEVRELFGRECGE